MVIMPVGIDQEPDRLVRQGRYSGRDPVGQGSKLIIDHEYAVCACRYADIASCAHQHVDTRRNLVGFNFHPGKLVFLRLRT